MKVTVHFGDKRVIRDRRRMPTLFLPGQAAIIGRRKTIRRREDRKTHILIDNYGLRLFILLLLLLLLSISDAYLTLTLVGTYGATELNPIMALYLEHGSVTFFFEKFLFTSVAVFLFCILNHFSAARISLGAAITLYFALVCYELSVMRIFLP